MITVSGIISRLTDVFTKDPDSNIGKLLTIMSEQLIELEETQTINREWRDLDQAKGTTLDLIGGNVVQDRGVATDEIYRILIKSKIARNLSTGDINTIISVISTSLNVDPSEVNIVEMYNDMIDPQPAGVSIIKVPLIRINEVGMSPNQFARIVQRTVAAGVTVGVIELTGTFLIGSLGDDFDLDTGFSNLAGTSGGTLGAAFAPEDDADLPI